MLSLRDGSKGELTNTFILIRHAKPFFFLPKVSACSFGK